MNTTTGILSGIASFIVVIFLVQMGMKYRGDAAGKQFIKVKRKYARLKTKVKISAVFVQMAVTFPDQFNVVYPQAYQDLCRQLGYIFSLEIFPSIPASCTMDYRRNLYFYHLLFQTLGPLVVIAFGLMYYSVRRSFLDRNDKQKLHESCMFWFLLLTYLVYPSCSTVVLAVFNCEDFDKGEKYMYADYSTSCDNNNHVFRVMQVYAAIFIFIYPLGCPLLYFVLMWLRRSDIDPVLQATNTRARMTVNPSDVESAIALRNEMYELAPLAFLFESFEPQYWWWEVSVCIERLLLTNANIYLASQPILRPFIVLVISLVFVKLYSYLDPYILDSDDLLAEITRWGIVANVIFVIIMQVHEETGKKIPAATNAMLITILLVVSGVFAYFALKALGIEMSFFQNMAERLFPETTEKIKLSKTAKGMSRRYRQISMGVKRRLFSRAGEEATNALEVLPGLDPESTGDELLTPDSGLEMAMFTSNVDEGTESGIHMDEDDIQGLNRENEPAFLLEI